MKKFLFVILLIIATMAIFAFLFNKVIESPDGIRSIDYSPSYKTCSEMYEKELKIQNQIIDNTLKLEENGDSIILIKNITDFKWDSLFYFEPYTYDTTIQRILKGQHTCWIKTNININDAGYLWVFKEADSIKHFFLIPIDFCTGFWDTSKGEMWSKNTSFSIKDSVSLFLRRYSIEKNGIKKTNQLRYILNNQNKEL